MGGERREIPLRHDCSDRNRGLGAADMVYTLRHGGGRLKQARSLYGVRDIMHAICDASREGKHVQLGVARNGRHRLRRAYRTRISE